MMNRETAIVYTVAAATGAAFAYAVNIPTGVVAGLATIGAIVIVWHVFDTVRGAIESHYAAKYTPKPGDKTSNAL